ncbi:MAG: hypothetical protein K2J39_08150, partial [Ruminococcus sp.]|nr:hypothetical protein [Ruminococcus sp.]
TPQNKKFWQQTWFKIGVPVLIIGGIVAVVLVNNKNDVPEESTSSEVESSWEEEEEEEEETRERLTADPSAGKLVESEPEEIEEDGVAVPGWSSLEFPANTTEVTVDFFNPEDNADKYSLTFELRLLNGDEDDYEVLYTSGLVDPGLYIQNINLSRGLAPGTYDAIIHVQPYRMDEDQTPTNNADLRTTIVVS